MEEQIDLMYIDAVRDVKLLALAYPEMYSLATRIMTPHRAEILSNTMKVQSPSLCLTVGASSKRGPRRPCGVSPTSCRITDP